MRWIGPAKPVRVTTPRPTNEVRRSRWKVVVELYSRYEMLLQHLNHLCLCFTGHPEWRTRKDDIAPDAFDSIALLQPGKRSLDSAGDHLERA
jgi:hypothetical protein